MTVVRAAMSTALFASAAVGLAPTAVAEQVTTLRLFEHDTQQTNLDLGARGDGPGDQLLFAGDVFDRPGGMLLGHIAGRCTTLSASDVLCEGTFVLADGEIAIQSLADSAALFTRGEPVPLAIVGGTGSYSNARGDGTAQAPEVPNQTDANFVLNVVTA
jgi:hypothetical protein